jgi:serine/threonine-protein kinase RsbW
MSESVSEIFSSVLVLPTDIQRLSVLATQTKELMTHAPRHGDLESLSSNITLAIYELCANIIKHAYGGERGRFMLSLTLLDDPWRVEVVTCDQGRCRFDAAQWTPPDLEGTTARGLGLFLMQSLMDRVTYLPEGGCTRWHMVKYLKVPVPASVRATVAAR